MPIVKFVKENVEIEAPVGANLRKEAVKAGVENLSPMGVVEKLRFRCPVPTPVTPGGLDPLPCLAFVGNEETMRLACQCKIQGDVEIETGPELDLFGENFFS